MYSVVGRKRPNLVASEYLLSLLSLGFRVGFPETGNLAVHSLAQRVTYNVKLGPGELDRFASKILSGTGSFRTQPLLDSIGARRRVTHPLVRA